MEHLIDLIMLHILLLKLHLHLRDMLLEPLQELKHLDSVPLEREDLLALLPDLGLTNGSYEGEVVLDSLKVVLWGQFWEELNFSC